MSDGESAHLARRVSDFEREIAMQQLNVAVSQGLISWDDHSSRARRVYEVHTVGDLEALVGDLGEVKISNEADNLRAVLGTVRRTISTSGRFTIQAVVGNLVLDLSELKSGQTVEIVGRSVLGNIVILVSADATVIDTGRALLGQRTVLGDSRGKGGPVIKLAGRNVLGNVTVRRTRPAS